MQIGDGGALARSLGIPVVNDFRGADVAAGGQGAPLAPLYHVALLADVELPVAVLNLGGMANLTWIAGGRPPIAFDTGPGNALIDRWVERHTGRPFDDGGALAASGIVSQDVVADYLADPFFDRLPPKSVDRLDFSLDAAAGLSVEDGAATLVEVTAAAVVQAVAHLPEAPARWYVTGGGRRNRYMMAIARRAAGRSLRPGRGARLAGRRAGGAGLRLPRHAQPARPAPQPAHDHRRGRTGNRREAASALTRN